MKQLLRFWLFELLLNDKFIMPFSATVGAALTLLLLQYVTRRVGDKKKKLYAIFYILDICFRLLRTTFILQKHTVLPHIEMIKRILKGDVELLEDTFVSDEFDILTANAI